MPEIQVPEIARQLARKFQITGGSIAPTLAPEIVPVALVSDMTGILEEDVAVQRSCVGGDAPGAVAGQRSHVQLFNPTASGTILQVEAVVVSRTTAGTIRIHRHAAEIGSASSVLAFRDRRVEGSPVAHLNTLTGVGAVGTAVGFISAPADEALLLPLDWVLDGGESIIVVPNDDNVGSSAMFYWTERAALPGE